MLWEVGTLSMSRRHSRALGSKSSKSGSKSGKAASKADEIRNQSLDEILHSKSGKAGSTKSSKGSSKTAKSGKSSKSPDENPNYDKLQTHEADLVTLNSLTPPPTTKSPTTSAPTLQPTKEIKSRTSSVECTGDPCDPDFDVRQWLMRSSNVWCRSKYGTCGQGSMHCNAHSTWKSSCPPTTNAPSSTHAPTNVPTLHPSKETIVALLESSPQKCSGDPCPVETYCRSRYGNCGPKILYCNVYATWEPSCAEPSSVPSVSPSVAEPIVVRTMELPTPAEEAQVMESSYSSNFIAPIDLEESNFETLDSPEFFVDMPEVGIEQADGPVVLDSSEPPALDKSNNASLYLGLGLAAGLGVLLVLDLIRKRPLPTNQSESVEGQEWESLEVNDETE